MDLEKEVLYEVRAAIIRLAQPSAADWRALNVPLKKAKEERD